MRCLEVFGDLFHGCNPALSGWETPLKIVGHECGRAEQVAEFADLTTPYRGVGSLAKIVVMVSVQKVVDTPCVGQRAEEKRYQTYLTQA